MENVRPRITVWVEGGIVQNVVSDNDADITVIDLDVFEKYDVPPIDLDLHVTDEIEALYDKYNR